MQETTSENTYSELCRSVETEESPELITILQERKRVLRKLVRVSVVCFFMMAAEVVGGIVSNSIAIFSDATHMLSDLTGFAISMLSVFISSKPAKKDLTFGYNRAEVLGAMASILLIWIITGVLLKEAIYRMIYPQSIDGLFMLVTAGIGFLCNLVMCRMLHHHHEHEHNVNIRAAIIHVLGDILQSVGVCIAALVIYFEPTWLFIDPICTVIFSVIVMFTTFPVVKDCVKILMEGVPSNIDTFSLKKDLEAIEEVIEVHDLHVWSLSPGRNSMCCHLLAKDASLALSKATLVCKRKHSICHTTIQTEPVNSEDFSCTSECMLNNF
mgnify:CR=1 FL=1